MSDASPFVLTERTRKWESGASVAASSPKGLWMARKQRTKSATCCSTAHSFLVKSKVGKVRSLSVENGLRVGMRLRSIEHSALFLTRPHPNTCRLSFHPHGFIANWQT